MKVNLICGSWQNETSPIKSRSPAEYLDVNLHRNGVFNKVLPKRWNSLIYPYSGNILYQSNGKTHQVQEH